MTTKPHITSLKVFPSVAKVLGHFEAQRQLFIAMHSVGDDASYFKDNKDLRSCFIWSSSKQEGAYWSDINKKIGINQ